jgi:hypothetical protein
MEGDRGVSENVPGTWVFLSATVVSIPGIPILYQAVLWKKKYYREIVRID